MAVGRRAAVGTKRVQPVAAALDGDKAASADAAHAPRCGCSPPGRGPVERAWGYPVAIRQVNHALPVHPPEHAHLRRPRQRAESCSEPCPTVQSLESVTFLLAHLESADRVCFRRCCRSG
jgi:hypothetical protein